MDVMSFLAWSLAIWSCFYTKTALGVSNRVVKMNFLDFMNKTQEKMYAEMKKSTTADEIACDVTADSDADADADADTDTDEFILGELKSSMTEFCGVTGDLSTLLSDRQYSSADSAVFHFDVSLQNQYDSSILFVSSEWLPNFESDRMATVSVIICKPRERGQHRLNTTVISSQSAFIKQKKCPYRSIRLSNIIDPNERNNNEPVQMLLVLRSEGFGHKKLPNEFRPYLQLGSRPQPRRPRTKYTSSCKQGQKHCCLDSKHLNIRNDLHNTSVGQLDIVEPENLHVHFCRGTCLRITANLLINTIENNVRPLSNERCCVPDGFNPIEVSVRAKNGRLQKKMLRSIDAKGCKCIH